MPRGTGPTSLEPPWSVNRPHCWGGFHQAVLEAQAAAIASYVPEESTGEQLCQASWRAMREAGFEQGITHFLGHGLGFAYHEDRPTLGPG